MVWASRARARARARATINKAVSFSYQSFQVIEPYGYQSWA